MRVFLIIHYSRLALSCVSYMINHFRVHLEQLKKMVCIVVAVRHVAISNSP